MDDRYELSASVALWRGDEILVMKRAAGFSAGGWFLPGGHVEPGERPAEAAARELAEEAGILVDAALLALADVMTYATPAGTAHTLIYNAACPEGADCRLNDEHLYFRWMTPEAYIDRFLETGRLSSKGLGEGAVALATEVGRAVRAAARARGEGEARSAERPLGWAGGHLRPGVSPLPSQS